MLKVFGKQKIVTSINSEMSKTRRNTLQERGRDTNNGKTQTVDKIKQ